MHTSSVAVSVLPYVSVQTVDSVQAWSQEKVTSFLKCCVDLQLVAPGPPPGTLHFDFCLGPLESQSAHRQQILATLPSLTPPRERSCLPTIYSDWATLKLLPSTRRAAAAPRHVFPRRRRVYADFPN
ncbi:hypothetical protein B0H12DRAFT_575386 [Mycena haematopus]|nr:hypothetical protein B0H12DRAFT_575386 [Mycena haematopus]